jgi:hypothetical protein
MESIFVLGSRKQAFWKLRPLSDRIRSQVNHFKRLEKKLPVDVRHTLPQHVIVTEDDAARYIEAMTRFLRSRIAVAPTPSELPAPMLRVTQIIPAAGKPVVKGRSSVGKKGRLEK